MRITIVGGGIVSLSSAVTQLADGHAVDIVDADRDRSAASWGNAGHIATEQTAPLASPASIRRAWRRRFAGGGALDLPLAQAQAWLPFVPRYLRASAPARFAAGQRTLTALLADALPAWRRLAADIGDSRLVRSDGHYVVWEDARTARSGAAAWMAADTGAATFHPATGGVRDLGLPLAGPFTRWMGARPTLPDYLPAIGRSRRVGNLLYAFGHQHLGLTLAPVTARIVAALARRGSPDIDIAPLAVERFGHREPRP